MTSPASSTVTTKHIIRIVRFVPKTNDGPCECSCGWEGLASQFADHRRAVDAGTGMQESDLPRAFSIWRRSAVRKTT